MNNSWLITDRARSTREGNVLTRVCPSICLPTPGGGGTLARSRGYPSQVQWGGWPGWGGTPARGTPRRVPLSDLAGGTHLGYPPLNLAGGYPCRREYRTSGTPLSDLARGYPTSGTPRQTWQGVPLPGGYPTLDTPPPPSDLIMRVALPGGGVPHLEWSTWYAAVGMPFAFTQEDFLVIRHAESLICTSGNFQPDLCFNEQEIVHFVNFTPV